MPDIREILNALTIDNRALWSEQRTIMRRSYLNAHNETVGMANWIAEDDAFMDLIDIRLALLFDRAGMLETTKEIIGSGKEIEQQLQDKEDAAKAKAKAITDAHMNISSLPQGSMSDASKLLQEGFSSEWPKGNAK